MFGILYMVATPIGNLQDITLRALRILKEADLIACEDTRRTKILLDRYEIKKPLVSYHQHSKLGKIDYLVEQLKLGRNIAVVSDAGTTGVSDPGGVLVEEALKAGLKIVPIPGPSAVTALISAAGIPMDKFLFLGFLPHKKGRSTFINKIGNSEFPVIFFESPHRILKTLQVLSVFEGKVIIGRELTKTFEEIIRGPTRVVEKSFENREVKGELVVIHHFF